MHASENRLPATVLSGFVGTDGTTQFDHVLANREPVFIGIGIDEARIRKELHARPLPVEPLTSATGIDLSNPFPAWGEQVLEAA